MRVARAPDELVVDEPVLVDRFLAGATELDVDVLCDSEGAWVAAILEHVEPAGVHSGDSACVIPAPSVSRAMEAEIRDVARGVAQGARGLLNLQLAFHRSDLYVLGTDAARRLGRAAVAGRLGSLPWRPATTSTPARPTSSAACSARRATTTSSSTDRCRTGAPGRR